MNSNCQETFLRCNLKNFLTNTLNFRIIHSMKIYKREPWTRGERILLEKWAGIRTHTEIAEMLPKRTETAVRKQIEYLRKRGWRV